MLISKIIHEVLIYWKKFDGMHMLIGEISFKILVKFYSQD